MSAPTNTAFQTALQRHLDTWALDVRSFTSGATPDDVLREVEKYEKANRDTVGKAAAQDNGLSEQENNSRGCYS